MGKEWEGTGKPLILFGGCNFRKGKYLCFCRESNSQCGGPGFARALFLSAHQASWLGSGPQSWNAELASKPKFRSTRHLWSRTRKHILT